MKERHQGIRFKEILLFCVFCFALFSTSVWGQTYKNLAQARQAAANAKSQDSLRSILIAAIPQLSIRDAITLCEEFESKAASTLRTEMRGTIAGLYLLLGQVKDASNWYTKAAALDPRFSMQAARLALAIGDTKNNVLILKSDLISKEFKTLLDIWQLVLDGDYGSALSRIKDAIAATSDRQMKSELLFLQYVAEFSQYGSASSTLQKENPSSIQTALLQGKVIPSSYLLILLKNTWLEKVSLEDYRRKDPSKDESITAQASYWLQVGYFSSKENAERLSKTLGSKKFETRMLEMRNKDGEARWAVQVACKEDWQKMQSALKDLGYESYLAEP